MKKTFPALILFILFSVFSNGQVDTKPKITDDLSGEYDCIDCDALYKPGEFHSSQFNNSFYKFQDLDNNTVEINFTGNNTHFNIKVDRFYTCNKNIENNTLECERTDLSYIKKRRVDKSKRKVVFSLLDNGDLVEKSEFKSGHSYAYIFRRAETKFTDDISVEEWAGEYKPVSDSEHVFIQGLFEDTSPNFTYDYPPIIIEKSGDIYLFSYELSGRKKAGSKFKLSVDGNCTEDIAKNILQCDCTQQYNKMKPGTFQQLIKFRQDGLLEVHKYSTSSGEATITYIYEKTN